MGCNLAGGPVVKLKDVLDEALLLVVDGALLAAHVHHHADILLANSFLVGVGVDPQQAEHGVGGSGEETHQGREEGGNGGEQAGDAQR